MEIVTIITLISFAGVWGYSVFVGINLRKFSGWFIGLLGFLCGFLFGFLNADMVSGLQIGALFAFIVIFGGFTVGAQRKHYQDIAPTWLERNSKVSNFSLITRIIKRLLHRD